ncbi:hypothetical protein A6E01_18865 (plasmid) [Vibrio breoganii]|uniref:AAA domain-containing protein n=1 Tax=Vibrio breoganii TaxID=553239 RepID=A0AAN0XZ30_9VIBR|nr:ParA family protein [Vibrio breoganii]ANO35279.1 hypothetical protein A6E01_18865 [Vibrio breoganii]PML12799.1 hypothetical protein BCT84_02635 [Vibrio breoganii]
MKLREIQNLSKRARLIQLERASIQQEYNDERSPLTFSKNQLRQLLSHAKKTVSETKLDATMEKMTEKGYEFKRKSQSPTSPYELTLDNCFDIASELGVKPHRHKKLPAFVAQIANLKGGVGKSMSANMIADACILLNSLILKQLRVLIIDLDPQGTSTENQTPNLNMSDTDYTSVLSMTEELSRDQLLNRVVKPTNKRNLSVIPCGTADGFITEALTSDEVCGDTKPYELLKKRVIDPLRYDFDIILLDAGPHMDTVMKNSLLASNGIFIPVPPTYANFDSSMKFIGKLDEISEELEGDNYNLDNLCFIKGFVAKDASHLNKKNNKHNELIVTTLKEDLKTVFGRNDVVPYALHHEDAFERCTEQAGTIFTIKKSDYTGADAAYDRALQSASRWAENIIETMLDYQGDLQA